MYSLEFDSLGLAIQFAYNEACTEVSRSKQYAIDLVEGERLSQYVSLPDRETLWFEWQGGGIKIVRARNHVDPDGEFLQGYVRWRKDGE